ncbi:MAG: hypothetical protein QM713_15270 [Arachnia sp.]
MTTSYECNSVAADPRAVSLALRMLHGAGAAALYAYRLDESIEFLAHGLLPNGSLVVAAAPEGMLGTLAPGFEVEVRMDVLKQTPDPAVSIVAASAHLLGSLSWAARKETANLVAAGTLPELVEATLSLPGARLGFVEVERLVLHDLAGATVIPLDALTRPFAVIEDEHAAFGAVARYDQEALKDLCWAVMVDAVPGMVVSKGPLPHVCEHTADKVFCVDVDPNGVTVMIVGREETVLVHASFDEPATSQTELEDRVSRLMKDSAPLPIRRI